VLVNGVQILTVAREHGFAVPAFNISDYGMLRTCVRAAEDARSPLIVLMHPSEHALMGDEVLLSVLALAARASVPVCVQLDHGANLEQALVAIRLGFTAVMIDGSRLDHDANIALTRTVVEVAHAVGVSVEGEIGTIGPRDPQSAADLDAIAYTDVDEAVEFVRRTGVDYLAVAVGTCHGVYPPGVAPDLRLDLVRDLSRAVDVPLVLHGGSGARDDQVSAATGLGVAKLNISADLKTAYFTALRKVLEDPTQREPRDIYPAALEAVHEVVSHKMAVTGSAGRSDLYTRESLAVGASATAAEPLLLQY
jgi:fructose-bisphosphate aldolase class II